FAQNIGCKGYPELQESARAEYHKSFSVPRELVMSDMGGPESYTVQAVYQRELQNLQRSYHLLDIAALEATAKSLASARRVLLFGRRFSHPIALHLALVLRRRQAVRRLTCSSTWVRRTSCSSCLCAGTRPRCSARSGTWRTRACQSRS
ncbi:MAG TPA: hypothetical protein PLT07_04075, partial [Trueperaceae bacterium]|nr:hypothetical protein [Trueperaceae bacterium]